MKLLLLCSLMITPLIAQVPVTRAPAPSSVAPQTEEVLRPPEPGRFKALFQPFRTELAAISPDGKYLAYTQREQETVFVVVLAIDQPEKMLAKVSVADDGNSTAMLAENQAEKTPARIRWMRWSSPTRLVLETNTVSQVDANTAGWKSMTGQILAFDADGGHARVLLRPQDLTEMIPAPGFFHWFDSRDKLYDMSQPQSTVPAVNLPPPDPGVVSLPPSGTLTEPTSPLLTPDHASTSPQIFHLFDLDPTKPACVTLITYGSIRTGNTRRLSFQRLDTVSGRVEQLHEDFLTTSSDGLLDRQGRLRLTLPNSLQSSFPFVYQYLGLKGRQRPHPLNETPGLSGFTVTPANFFGERAVPLGFDENPDILYYASNQGRNTYGIYSFNLATGQRGRLALENPTYDLIAAPTGSFLDPHTLVFDRYQHALIGIRYDNALRSTAWIQPDLHTLQAELEKKFPGRSVEISDWDEARHRFVISTEGPADPGAFYVYDVPATKLIEFVRRAPWVDENHTHLTVPFSFVTPEGALISGLATAPRHPRLKPIPLVILCPDLPWLRVSSHFQTDVQALADMGFVVVQLNGRGAWGLGLRQRQSLTAGYDLVQVDDLVNTVGLLGKLFNVNLHRVALLGRGHGGFIALRTLQSHPEMFRCAIAIDAPVDLAAWLEQQKWGLNDVQPQLTRAWLGDATRLTATPLARHPEAITKPILMLNYPGPDGTPRNSTYLAARNFSGQVREQGTTAEFVDLRTDYMAGLPAARAEVFDRIEAFLNVNVYDYTVRLPEMKILK